MNVNLEQKIIDKRMGELAIGLKQLLLCLKFLLSHTTLLRVMLVIFAISLINMNNSSAVTRIELAEHWAPVIYQKVNVFNEGNGLGGRADFITNFDFDKDDTVPDKNICGNDNWNNIAEIQIPTVSKPLYPLLPYVYYDVKETASHWFIYYAIFHPRDWGYLSLSSFEHENDMEAMLFVIKRMIGDDYGELIIIESMGHNIWMNYPIGQNISVDPQQAESDFISDELNKYSDHRYVAYIEARGHGIYFDKYNCTIAGIKIGNWFNNENDKFTPGVVYLNFGNFAHEEPDLNKLNSFYDSFYKYDLIDIKKLWELKDDPDCIYCTDSQGYDAFCGTEPSGSGNNQAHPPWSIPDYVPIGNNAGEQCPPIQKVPTYNIFTPINAPGRVFRDPAAVVETRYNVIPEKTYIIQDEDIVKPTDPSASLTAQVELKFNGNVYPIVSSLAGLDILSLTWDFGDGVTEVGMNMNPIHIYNEPNNYQVKITVNLEKKIVTENVIWRETIYFKTNVDVTSQDNVPPTVGIVSPFNNETVNGRYGVTASAEDDGKVNRVEFYLDNVLELTDYSSPYNWSWDTTKYANGSYSLSAKAYDLAGNVGVSPSITVTVNNSSGNNPPNTPTFFGQFKSDGSGIGIGGTTDERSIALEGDVTDPDGNAVSLEVEVKALGTAFSNSPSSNCSTGGSVASGGTASVTCSSLEDGQYHWQARAKDNNGAVSNWQSAGGNLESDADFIVSSDSTVTNYPPTVTLISPNGGETLIAGSSYEIKWIANDKQELSIFLLYSPNGGVPWTPIAGGLSNTGSFQWDVPDISTGSARVRVLASDGELTNIVESASNFSIVNSCIPPSTPTLSNPGLWSETGNYNIFWQNIGSATGYLLQESTSSSFVSFTEYTTVAPSKYISGKVNGTYYYRVKAVNDCNGSGWSNTVDMEVRVNAPPNRPGNPFPSDGQNNVQRTQPILSWTGGDADGTVEYAVGFGTTQNPSIDVGFGGVAGTSYQIPTTLQAGTKYYWVVKARDDKGLETESPIWSFTTEYSYPDLIPIDLSITGNVAPDVQVTLNLTVKNQGTFTAPGCRVYFYNSSISGGKEQKLNIPGTTIPQLTPGNQTTVSETVTLNNLKAGQSYIDAWIDTQGCSSIGDEISNNTISKAVEYLDNNNPVITFLGLSNRVAYRTGYEYSIIYEVNDDIGISTADLYYSTDNGATWIAIIIELVPRAGSGADSYSWMIPGDMPLTDQLQIKMVVWDTVANSAEAVAGPYTVVSGVAPVITILSPNGGEVWEMGSTQEIRWDLSAPNGISGMSLYFENPNGIDWIAGLTSNTDSTYSWTLRDNFSTKEGKIRIYVEDLNGNASEDRSDGYFEIKDTSAPPPAPWTTPEVITEGGSPQITVDASGTLHMVYMYHQDVLGTPRVITDKILYKKRVGTTWSSPMTIYSKTQETDYGLSGYYSFGDLQIAVDSQGSPHIIWQQGPGSIPERNDQDVFYSRFDGSQWLPPENLSEGIKGPYFVSTLTWSGIADMPVAKESAAAAVVNGKLHVFGGNQRLSHFAYDPPSNSWSTKANLPGNGISEGGAVVINGKIYATGGPSHDVKIYDPSNNTWMTGAIIPTARRYPSVAAVNGKMYVIGGRGPASSKNEVYDPLANTWSTRTPMPTARGLAAVAVVDNKIYVIGGESGSVSALSTIEVYDPQTDTWETLVKPIAANWPRPRGSVATVANGKIYLMGGRDRSKQVDEFDPSTSSWRKMNPMAYNREIAVAGVIDSMVYVAGGYDTTGDFYLTLSSVERANIASGLDGAISGSPAIIIDTSDTVSVTWTDGGYWVPDSTNVLGFSYGGMSNIYHRKRGAAQDWSSISQLTTAGASYPALASDSFGNLHLAYTGDGNISYIKWDGTSWSSPVTASTSAGGYIDLVADTNGLPHMVWYYYNSANSMQEILYSYYDGTSWSSSEKVSNDLLGSQSQQPSIVVDSLNRPHVIWEIWNWPSKLFYRYKDVGGWSSAIQLHFDSQIVIQNSSDATISPVDDQMHVVWASGGEVLYNYADVSSAIDTSAPTVTVTSPSARESLSIGAVYNITWDASDSVGVDTITIEYTIDGGTTYTPIATSEANDGSYQWTVQNISSDTVQIRITASDVAGNSGYGTSGIFSILDGSPPSVTVSTPNGGEIWIAGSQQNIVWSATDNIEVSSIDLQYSVDGGSSWVTIVQNITNSGLYLWAIPDILTSNVLVKVVAHDDNGLVSEDSSDILFSIVRINNPPVVPHSPYPLDNEISVSLNTTLRWIGGDIDGDTVTYDVYFGTDSNPPKVSSGQAVSSFDPDTLIDQTVYYWKVVASDGKNTSVGPLWTFTTGKETINAPSNLTVEGASNSQINLSWSDNANNESGFLIERKRGLNGAYILIAVLEQNTVNYLDIGLNSTATYIYRVRAYDGLAFSVYSSEASATTANTPPNVPGNPMPTDGALDQSIDVTLRWSGGDPDIGDSISYDVYFGTTSNPPLVSSDQPDAFYSPGILSSFTTYYWKIISKDSKGGTSIGPLWYFVTQYVDDILPTIAIVNPTTNNTFIANNGNLNIGGIASDNVGVTQVTWSNDRGGSGTASGTTSWSVDGITLQSGTNVITVTSRDAANNTRTDTLTVTYNYEPVDRYVCKGGCQYSSIQDAIDDSGPGDTILVGQGTYYENISVTSSTNNLLIQGGWSSDFSTREKDLSETVIDGTRSGSVFNIYANGIDIDVTIDGFIIKNGSGTDGGGMYAYSENGGGVTLNLTNNILSENSANDGGGIYVFADSGGSATLALKNNTITENVASGDGGGIYAGTGVVIDIKNTISWGNKATGTGNDVCITDGTVRASYSNIGEVYINSGTYNDNGGNINDDPLFANPDIGDYHLTPCSPCIDTGTNDVELSIDYEGDTRLFDGDGDNVVTIDIGADEYTRPGATNVPPVADAGPDQSGIVGETMTFDGSSSYDPDGTIVSYDWDFGDRTTASGIIVGHVYEADGSYSVTLTITDDQETWCSDTTQVETGCTYSISLVSREFDKDGGSGSVRVTAENGCDWTAIRNASWINITSGSSGSGNGTVEYSVLPKTTVGSRTGTMTIAGKTFTVSQAGLIVPKSCPELISPGSKSFGSGGGTDNVNVVALGDCNWTVTSNASWITIISPGASVTGSGTVDYSVSPNTSASSRTGNIAIDGSGIDSERFQFTVTQAGTNPTPNIKASSSDGPITSGTSDTLSVTVSLAASGSLGMDCDWWVAADTPFGWYYFDVGTMNWTYAGDSYTDLSPTYQGPLFDLNLFEVLNMSDLPVGAYIFYFAIDTNMNGSLDFDELYFNSVVVNIIP